MDDKDLPPVWYSKLELFYICNKVQIWAVVYILVFVVLPLIFMGSETLDSVLVDGIAGGE
jgi:hypothetical protein